MKPLEVHRRHDHIDRGILPIRKVELLTWQCHLVSGLVSCDNFHVVEAGAGADLLSDLSGSGAGEWILGLPTCPFCYSQIRFRVDNISADSYATVAAAVAVGPSFSVVRGAVITLAPGAWRNRSVLVPASVDKAEIRIYGLSCTVYYESPPGFGTADDIAIRVTPI